VKIGDLVIFLAAIVFVVAGCIVYMLAVVVSFIIVLLYCVCALFVCNLRYLSVVLFTTAIGLKPNCSFTNIYYI
jgi:hypothetical protein